MIKSGSLMKCIKDKQPTFTRGNIYTVVKASKRKGWYIVTTDRKRGQTTCRFENIGMYLVEHVRTKRNLPSWW